MRMRPPTTWIVLALSGNGCARVRAHACGGHREGGWGLYARKAHQALKRRLRAHCLTLAAAQSQSNDKNQSESRTIHPITGISCMPHAAHRMQQTQTPEQSMQDTD